MRTLGNLSADELRRAAAIKDEIEKLNSQLTTCLGGHYTGNGFAPLGGNRVGNGGRARPHWTQTPAGRAKMARLMKRTWKNRRKK